MKHTLCSKESFAFKTDGEIVFFKGNETSEKRELEGINDGSSKCFDLAIPNSNLKFLELIENSVTPTTPVLYDIGLFDEL